MIAAVIREPFHLSSGVLMADKTADRRDFPVLHDSFLGVIFPGDKFFIRPVPDQDLLRLRLRGSVSIDGEVTLCPTGSTLAISRAPHCARVIQRTSNNFANTLRQKLLWGTDQR